MSQCLLIAATFFKQADNRWKKGITSTVAQKRNVEANLQITSEPVRIMMMTSAGVICNFLVMV